jgi:hypothetical protein
MHGRLVTGVHRIIAADQCSSRQEPLRDVSIGNGHAAAGPGMMDATYNKCGIQRIAEDGTCIIPHETQSFFALQ